MRRGVKKVLATIGTLSYITPRPVHPRDALMRRRGVGRGRCRAGERMPRSGRRAGNTQPTAGGGLILSAPDLAGGCRAWT